MALHNEIRDDIYDKISDGTYREGDSIPSEIDLASSYGVSRSTIRQALQALVHEGYLERRKRRGTIVTRPKVDQFAAMGIRSFEEEQANVGRKIRTTVINFKRQRASAEVARALELSAAAEVWHLVRLRYVDDRANVFVESYVPCELYPGFDEYDFATTRLYGAMAEKGRPVVRAHRRLGVIKADSAMGALLDVSARDPLILMHTVGRDEDGNAVEYSIATYRGENNVFEFDVVK